MQMSFLLQGLCRFLCCNDITKHPRHPLLPSNIRSAPPLPEIQTSPAARKITACDQEWVSTLQLNWLMWEQEVKWFCLSSLTLRTGWAGYRLLELSSLKGYFLWRRGEPCTENFLPFRKKNVSSTLKAYFSLWIWICWTESWIAKCSWHSYLWV